MILPRHQHRFEGDSGVDIAAHAIDARFPDGENRRVLLRLGAPFRKPDSKHPEEWWIRTELEHLDSTDGPIAGAGSFHTLILGIRWIVARLQTFEEKHHCRYFWADSDEPFDYRSIFATYVPKG
jgi:hypothetical protein